MNQYQFHFKDQAFSGAVMVFKKIWPAAIVISLIISLFNNAIQLPLLLKMMNWDFETLNALQSKLQEISRIMQKNGDPSAQIESLFGQVNYVMILPFAAIASFLYAWNIELFYQLNQHEIEHQARPIGSIFKLSFNKQIVTQIVFLIVFGLLMGISFMLFMLIVASLSKMLSILGILVGFIGFFVWLLLMLRFLLAPAAIALGKYKLNEAFGFSYQNITFKRAAMIGLIGLVVFIGLALLGYAFGAISLPIASAIGKQFGTAASYISLQLLNALIGGISNAFIFACSAALYYRYSNHDNDNTASTSEV